MRRREPVVPQVDAAFAASESTQRIAAPLLRHQPNCIKPQIAMRAETTRAAHDTFIGTLYGPICTVHRLTFHAGSSQRGCRAWRSFAPRHNGTAAELLMWILLTGEPGLEIKDQR